MKGWLLSHQVFIYISEGQQHPFLGVQKRLCLSKRLWQDICKAKLFLNAGGQKKGRRALEDYPVLQSRSQDFLAGRNLQSQPAFYKAAS